MKYSVRMRVYYWAIVLLVALLFSAAMAFSLLFLSTRADSPKLSLVAFIAIMAVFTAIAGILAYYVARRIAAPMVKLSEASREVAHRNFDVHVSDSSRLEEVQSTFRNFNAMVQELQRIDTLSNDFIASVSHEFKTPLTAIEGYAMLLQDPALGEEEREEYLGKILFNTQRLSSLVTNVLTLSRLESQALAEQQVTFRLDEQIRHSILSLEPMWSNAGTEFDLELSPVSIRGCASLLDLVWCNLVSNAIKFSPPGSTVSVRLREHTECIIAEVQDQGCGLSAQEQSRIFEKFYQADPAHKVRGNGLGLSLVKRIVELSDGVIEVESSPGSGALFRVILPKA